jgi:hypothetical protein
MEMSYEDALEEYYTLFDGHNNPEFLAQTNVLQLLRTKGVKVFVPHNWEGIYDRVKIEIRHARTYEASDSPSQPSTICALREGGPQIVPVYVPRLKIAYCFSARYST